MRSRPVPPATVPAHFGVVSPRRLTRALCDTGYACVLVVAGGKYGPDKTRDGIDTACLPVTGVAQPAGVDLFICAGHAAHTAPVAARRMVIRHALPDTPIGQTTSLADKLSHEMSIGGKIDALFATFRQGSEKWTPQTDASVFDWWRPERMIAQRSDPVFVLPGGYPKIQLRKQAAAVAERRPRT